MKKVRHVLGISGGKDSAALAIYMHKTCPQLEIEYYTADTGKELKETYKLIDDLQNYLGKEIIHLQAFPGSEEVPFDHKLKTLGGFLPSAQFRWCTKSLKLDPFEKFVGDDPVISYVGIRGDEDREGYISKKPNIQAIFPFRENIWSEDVITRVLSNQNIGSLIEIANEVMFEAKAKRFVEILQHQISPGYTQGFKLKQLLQVGIKELNRIVFAFLKSTDYPLGGASNFPLVENEDVLVKKDIFKLLEDTVGVPAYYKEVEFEVNGRKGTYSRSRSGCFFCFFQQRIEWVWLYEQHPDLFWKAVEYEKEGYTWYMKESLLDLIKSERIISIKTEYLNKSQRAQKSTSPFLVDILNDEAEGCAACFI